MISGENRNIQSAILTQVHSAIFLSHFTLLRKCGGTLVIPIITTIKSEVHSPYNSFLSVPLGACRENCFIVTPEKWGGIVHMEAMNL